MTENLIENIVHDGEIIATIIHGDYQKEGISFITQNDLPQQLAYMKHPKGKIIEPHQHKPIKREIIGTMEVLVIKSGKIRVDFFDKNRTYIQSKIIGAGDTIVLISDCHGFNVLEDLEMLEIKQGPYAGNDDKVKFEYNLSDLDINLKTNE